MTQDEIIEMASKCLLINKNTRDGIYVDALIDFAKLVAAKEREEWAKEFAGLGEWNCVHMIEARNKE